MTLLEDIRDDLVAESVSLPDTLRKAKILAHQLGLLELRQWADSELGGYGDLDKVPDYRCFRANNLGTFFGPYGSGVKNQMLPTIDLPEPLKSFAEHLVVRQNIRALEEMLSQESARFPWPAEFVELAREHIVIEGMALVEAHQPIPNSVFAGILDTVKTRLLDFVLDVPVTDDELREGTFDRSQVRNIFLTNVYGNQNVVAVGETVSQGLSEILAGNRESLLAYLRNQGIADDDLNSLDHAISSETTASKNRLGPLVSSWIGQMMVKGVSGAWDVASQTASSLLVEALGKFYGW